jgi:hypothetical protein
MKRISFLLLTFLIVSCELQFEDNERLLVQGSVEIEINSNLNGKDIPVDVFVSDGVFNGFLLFPIPSVREKQVLIGTNKLDNDGFYNVTAISPQEPNNIFCIINDPISDNYQETLGTIVFNHLNFLGEDRLEYELPKSSLKTIIETQLNIVREENMADTISYMLSYPNKLKEIDFKSGNEEIQAKESMFGRLLPNEEQLQLPLKLPRDSKINVIVQVINNGTISEDEVELSMNPENDEYELRL